MYDCNTFNIQNYAKKFTDNWCKMKHNLKYKKYKKTSYANQQS